jgi:hypothetical protein
MPAITNWSSLRKGPNYFIGLNSGTEASNNNCNFISSKNSQHNQRLNFNGHSAKCRNDEKSPRRQNDLTHLKNDLTRLTWSVKSSLRGWALWLSVVSSVPHKTSKKVLKCSAIPHLNAFNERLTKTLKKKVFKSLYQEQSFGVKFLYYSFLKQTKALADKIFQRITYTTAKIKLG